MTQAVLPSFDLLRTKLDAAVAAPDVATIAQQVKQALQEVLHCNGLSLPPGMVRPIPDSYARRLLHRDPAGRYTAIVMTWGPAQKTPLHDHAGIWCVECVVDGNMDVTQFDLVAEEGNNYRFEQKNSVSAARGSAGCLIPPFEYHTLGNHSSETPSVTLHVYGGEMDHCHVFEPNGDGTFRRVRKCLSYHE
jgi:predicted metal-dependent enzyme (double-stranded beta helix superfamily)